jgi:prophage DNA circulation protein
MLYGDTTRANEIIGRNNGWPNPGFMPATLEVLAS